jgi:hypothetical protein
VWTRQLQRGTGDGHSGGTIQSWQWTHWRTTAAGQGASHWCFPQRVLLRPMILTLGFCGRSVAVGSNLRSLDPTELTELTELMNPLLCELAQSAQLVQISQLVQLAQLEIWCV